MAQDRRYDVAISFAGEDRKYAEALAGELRRRGVSVFYDAYEKAALWGRNHYTHLSDPHTNQAHFCVMLLSAHYAANAWTRHEREAAQARAHQEPAEYILPVSLDDTEIPGILATTGYLKWPPETAVTVAEAILTKLGAQAQRRPSLVAEREKVVTEAVSTGKRTPTYCTTCGASPGTPSSCTLGISHSFQRMMEPVYCGTCGATPGEPTRCTLGISHSFRSLKGTPYCGTCGATPGQPSKCTLGISHSFRES